MVLLSSVLVSLSIWLAQKNIVKALGGLDSRVLGPAGLVPVGVVKSGVAEGLGVGRVRPFSGLPDTVNEVESNFESIGEAKEVKGEVEDTVAALKRMKGGT